MRRLTRAQPRAKRRLPPKPEAPADGIYMADPDGGEMFIKWSELEGACKDMFNPEYFQQVEEQLGKMYWKRDPTYHLNRRTKPR